jgi:signal peptidase I
VRKTEPDKLKAGDNITYMRGPGSSVTHKIETVHKNYQNSGTIGFTTKGTNNAAPDREAVHEGDVIGKVILIIPGAGAAIARMRANIHIIYIIFGMSALICFTIHFLHRQKQKARRVV